MAKNAIKASASLERLWQEHAEALNRRYAVISAIVALISFCGGITFLMYLTNVVTTMRWIYMGFTLSCIFVGLALHFFARASSLVLCYLVYIGMATNISYLIAITPANSVQAVMGHIPVFLAFALIILWKTKHSVIILVYDVLVGAITFVIFSAHPFKQWITWWVILMPMGLGMILLIRFKYHAWRNNFIVSQQLKETNEELKSSNEIIQLKQAQLEYKDAQITSSLNYASRIQKALLPSVERMKEYFPHHFVLFKPKDVVSGDFYWMQRRQGKIYLALVDCTGHGIPGGFMSMIGHGLLDNIVLEKGISSPAYILSALSQGVRKVLQQENSENKDGMDAALCVFDFEKREMEFAGAKGTLFYVQEGQGHYIKGDATPIGGHGAKSQHFYQTHTIPFGKGIHIYLSSDGYADQFGGPERKKIMSKNFRKMLLDRHKLPMLEQKQWLEEHLEQWKAQGQERQIDDILVIGLTIS